MTSDLKPRERRRRALVPTPRLAGVDELADASYGIDERSARRGVKGVIADWARQADPRSIPGSKVPLLVLGLIGMLATWDLNASGVLFFEMRVDFGIDLTFIATLLAAITAIGFMGAPFMGYLVDRVNRVWFLRIALVVGGLGALLTANAGSVAMLVLSRAMGAMAIGYGGAVGAPVFPLVSDWYPSHVRARAFGFLNAASVLGAILGPIVGGTLASTLGWRSAYWIFAALVLTALAGTALIREPVRGSMDRLELGASEDVARKPQSPPGLSEAWRSARSIATLRRLWYAQPFVYIGGAGALYIMSALFTDVYDLTPGARGIVAGIGQAAGLITLIIVTPLMDRLLERTPERSMSVMGIIPLVQAILFVVMALSGIVSLSIVLGIGLAMIGALNGVVIFALMSLVTPARVRGLGLQVGNLWQLPGLLLLPIILNYLTDWNLRAGMLLFAPILTMATVILVTGGGAVKRDMRAARAAALADEEAERARREHRDQMVIIRDLDVTYDGTQVLFGVDLDIGAGDMVALLGTNGAGKSTLLRAIVGLQQASNGAVFIDGQDITHAPPHENARRGIVMVPGGRGVFPTLTVTENLATAADAAGLDGETARARVAELFDLFPSLRERANTAAGNLSGGEQQMLSLGQAFLARPRLLMIDELSLGLAPALVEQLIGTVRRINEAGTTVVLVEQSINVALTIAERAIFMEKGEIRFDGSVAELLGRGDLVRAVFMGGALAGARRHWAKKTGERNEVLHAEDIVVRYGGIEALRGASISVARGEIVGVIGPNGAGKTTLFDAIAGHAPIERGQIVLEGADVTALPPDERARRGLGRSFQDARLFGSLTVRECIALAFERHIKVRDPFSAALRLPRARAEEARIARRVDALVYLFGLTAYADKFVHELSTGTRRAVDIACVSVAEPDVVLLDEPSSGLAQAEAESLAPLLLRLVRETGSGMLVIEHDLPLISSIADRLVVMDLGGVLADGRPDEVLADPRVVEAYLAATDEVIQRSDLRRVRARAELV